MNNNDERQLSDLERERLFEYIIVLKSSLKQMLANIAMNGQHDIKELQALLTEHSRMALTIVAILADEK